MENDTTYQYQVADLTFELKLAKEDSLNQHLSNYEPFVDHQFRRRDSALQHI